MLTETPRIDPWLAAGLSILVPGLGHAAAGRTLRGLVWLAAVIGSLAGFLWWILSPDRVSPYEAGGWVAAMGLAEIGNAVDAYRMARRMPPQPQPLPAGRRPEPAATLSLIVPGLGQAYLLCRRWWHWVLALPVCLAPAGFLMVAENLEPGMLENPSAPTGTGLPIRWPAWAMDWPGWLAFTASAALSAVAVIHAWRAGSRAAGRPDTRIPLSRPLLGLALAGWIVGLCPWEGWLKDHVVRSFVIPSESMEPTLIKDDRLWARRMTSFHRFDIVVFRPPDRPDQDYIKRVIGLPGETLALKGKTIWINGTPLREFTPVYRAVRAMIPLQRNFGPVEIPPRCYFVMGDNRDESRDSRYFGFVPVASIYGKAYKIFWPRARSGPLR